MALLGHARGALELLHLFSKISPSLSFVAASRRHDTGASGGLTSLHPGTSAQRG
jgi:hypothetical protein